VITIEILPLRECREDIVPLSFFFIDKFNKAHGLNKIFSKKVFDRFVSYDWPGNIRELENIIERLVLTTENQVVEEDELPDYMTQIEESRHELYRRNLTETVEALEKRMIRSAYEKYGTTVGVAKALGISQSTASEKYRNTLMGSKVIKRIEIQAHKQGSEFLRFWFLHRNIYSFLNKCFCVFFLELVNSLIEAWHEYCNERKPLEKFIRADYWRLKKKWPDINHLTLRKRQDSQESKHLCGCRI
jgi:hypothetical protein